MRFNDAHRCHFCGQTASPWAMAEADMMYEALNLEIQRLRMVIAELRGAGAGRSVAMAPAGPLA